MKDGVETSFNITQRQNAAKEAQNKLKEMEK